MGRSDGLMSPRQFLGTVAAIVLLDQFTKLIAVDRLSPAYVPHPVLGEFFRLTLVFNKGAAFGLHLGHWSRWIFIALTIVAVTVMWRLYRTSPPGAHWRVRALCLVIAGALGNFIDRVSSSRGVVDFLDFGVTAYRWPTFNVADIAVSTGAVLLAIVLWREEQAAERAEKDRPDAKVAAEGG
jgi:signal peptidase II